MPEINVSITAVVVAMIANFIFGFIWYTPLFGKAWGKEMGYDPEMKPEMGPMMKGMIAMLVGNFLLAFVLGHNMAAYDSESWGLGPSEMSKMTMVLNAGIFTWLGFYFPVDLGNVFWEKKSWKLFGINTSYHLFSLLLVATILVNM